MDSHSRKALPFANAAICYGRRLNQVLAGGVKSCLTSKLGGAAVIS